MTLTVSLTQVGIVRATEILHQARSDAAQRHDTEPRTVAVEIERAAQVRHARASDVPAGQRRIVDLQI